MALIILLGLNQPMTLLVISACLGGPMMFRYPGLLIALNRAYLPNPIRVRGVRLGVWFWSICFFGLLAALTVWQQGQRFR